MKLVAEDDSVEIIRISTRKEGGPVLFGFNPESKATVKLSDRKELQEFFDSQNFPSPPPQLPEEERVPYYQQRVCEQVDSH